MILEVKTNAGEVDNRLNAGFSQLFRVTYNVSVRIPMLSTVHLTDTRSLENQRR